MDKTISLEGRGMIPCPLNEAEAHPYKGPPLSVADLLTLLDRATMRQVRLSLAIDNLRRILREERILDEDTPELPHLLLEEIRQALSLAQSVIPGAYRDALVQVTQALEHVDAYQDRMPPRGMA